MARGGHGRDQYARGETTFMVQVVQIAAKLITAARTGAVAASAAGNRWEGSMTDIEVVLDAHAAIGESPTWCAEQSALYLSLIHI